MLVFPLPVKAQMSDTWSSPVRIVQFGDGYSERSANGLNRANEVWDVECAFASEIAGANLQTFLETVGGWQAFLWQSPRDTSSQTYIVVQPVSSNVRRGGGSKPYFYTRSLKFKRVYMPPPVPPTVTVIANGTSGWIFSRTGSTADPLTVSFKSDITPIPGTLTSSNLSATFTAGSGTVIVPSGSSGDRTETATILPSSNYNIGNPGTATFTLGTFILVAANGKTGWTATRTGSASGVLTVYTYIVVDYFAVAPTVDIDFTFAAGSNTKFIPVLAYTGELSQELIVKLSQGYYLGIPHQAKILLP